MVLEPLDTETERVTAVVAPAFGISNPLSLRVGERLRVRVRDLGGLGDGSGREGDGDGGGGKENNVSVEVDGEAGSVWRRRRLLNVMRMLLPTLEMWVVGKGGEGCSIVKKEDWLVGI